MPPKTIYVLGCFHQLQRHVGPPRGKYVYPLSAEQAKQANQFEAEIARLSDHYDFNAYCEESDEAAFTALEKLAIERKKRYISIDMPLDVRKLLGIPSDLNDPGKHPPENLKRWHTMREDYMYERATSRMESGKSVLVVCSHYHCAPLSSRFRALGGQVIEDNLLNFIARAEEKEPGLWDAVREDIRTQASKISEAEMDPQSTSDAMTSSPK